MAIAHSKLTSQGQISVPAVVRKRLGLGPGSVIEWDVDEDGNDLVVRRGVQYSSEDIHRAIFPEPPEPKTLEELKEGIGDYMRKRYGKR